MSYILIENKGEIHIDALILMGGTTKRNSTSSIGFFGSGNKYSIATLLKHNIPFKIFSGENEFKIESRKYQFRDVELDKIYINNTETNLTTSMGPDWEPSWMPIREWLSNAIDEGEFNVITSIDNAIGIAGKTRMYIELTPEIQKVVGDWDNYFTLDRIDSVFENGQNKLFPNLHREDKIIMFRRGIRCYEGSDKSLYHYDLNQFEINESRVIKSDYSARIKITVFLNNITSTKVISDILKNGAKEKLYEGNLVWGSWEIPNTFSNEWRQVIGENKIIPYEMSGWFENEQSKYDCFIVQTELARRIKKVYPDVTVYGLRDDGDSIVRKTKIELDNRKSFLLNECKKFFQEANYVVDYPIEVVKFEDYDKLGLAEDKIIYISEKLFTMGKREIASTIVEENEHLKTGYSDESRAFQQHFINKYISEIEERIAFFL
jgi:hypothetical protein